MPEHIEIRSTISMNIAAYFAQSFASSRGSRLLSGFLIVSLHYQSSSSAVSLRSFSMTLRIIPSRSFTTLSAMSFIASL